MPRFGATGPHDSWETGGIIVANDQLQLLGRRRRRTTTINTHQQQYSIAQREVSHEECRAPKDGLLPITGE
jgi:hypothetical protein